MLKRKRLTSIVLALVMLLSVITVLPRQASAASDFNDVGRNHTFYPFVNYVKNEDYVDGYGDGNYGPGDPMTRAQVAKLLVNAKGLTVDEGAKNTDAFNDTNGHDLEPYIAASKGEIFDGYKGNFSPQAKILRGQAAKVVVNALDLKLKAGKALDFKDVPANHEFAEYIAILSSQGIVSGYQGKFNPEAPLTRGAFAKYVANAATIPAASAAVEKAEETGNQADIERAQDLINALPDKEARSGLQVILDEMGNEEDLEDEEAQEGIIGGADPVKPSEPSQDPIAVTDVSVSVETLVLAEEDTTSILATVLPSNATNKKVTWTSSDEAIVSVDSNGKVTAIAAGTASITATTVDGGKTANTEVTVIRPSSEADFEFDHNTGTITGYNGRDKNIVIPAKINEVTVKAIGDSVFYNNLLTEVTIPNSVTTIGADAFYNNKLTKVIIPNSVKDIGLYAFSSNKLESITISNSVTTIEAEAFSHNNLTSITIPDSVTSIRARAFYVNKLTSITIPNSVKTIGERAFYDNELRSIKIPDSVTTIGEGAFNNNQLPEEQAFIYEREADGSEDKTKIISYGGEKREDVEIPNSVTTIGAYAFAYNGLTSTTIPDSVTTIGEGAFRFNNLRSIAIPDSVTTIEGSIFSDNLLTEVTIPNSVKDIGDHAFSSNKLESLTIPNSLTTIGWGAFSYNKLTSLTLGNSVTSIGNFAFSNNKLTEVTIPNSVSTIGKYAFRYNNLTSLTLGDSVTSIGDSAFLSNKLTSITIPNSVGTIEADAFARNGPEKNSGDIPRADFVGAWEIAEGSTEWTKKN